MVCINKNDFVNFEYNEEYFKYLLDSKTPFDREDIKAFLEICEEIEQRDYGEPGRWERPVSSYCKIKDKWYAVYWQQGLTEMQEDYYEEQPVEVIPHIYKKTINIILWEEVKN